MSKGKPADKKEEKQQKVNYEDVIFSHLSAPKLSLDKTGFAFTNLTWDKSSLESIPNVIINFKYITTIDLSNNKIVDFSVLAGTQSLLSLNLENNNIKDIRCLASEEGFRNLKFLKLNGNKVMDLAQIKCPNLLELDLNDNKIEKTEGFDGHPRLTKLYLKKNKILALTNINNMPNLKELYLSENKIKSFQGLDNLNSLTKLFLRKNNFDAFDETLPTFENLAYVNLRENKIDKFEELAKFSTLEKLRTLIFSFNPIIAKNVNTYVYETMNLLPKLEIINKIKITNNIREKSIKFAEMKWSREQEAKRKAEEEERLRQENPDIQDNN